MPPSKEAHNILRAPGDYEVTTTLHNDTYPAINPHNTNLHGTSVFISGGSRGLGRAMALSFARAGAFQIAVGARSDLTSLAQEIQTTAKAATRSQPQFLPVQLDVTDAGSVAAAATAVEKAFGKLHVVINNAGLLGKYGLIADSDVEAWGRVMDVNLRGPYLVTRAFLPLLLRTSGPSACTSASPEVDGAVRGGTVTSCTVNGASEEGEEEGEQGGGTYVINITSGGALLTNPTLSAYQVSKAALLKLTTLTSVEYKDKGIVALAIHPGNVPTDIMGGKDAIPEHYKHVFVETPELSADSIVYLVSKKRAWLSGRYVNCMWDLPELMAMEEDVVREDKLKVHFRC